MKPGVSEEEEWKGNKEARRILYLENPLETLFQAPSILLLIPLLLASLSDEAADEFELVRFMRDAFSEPSPWKLPAPPRPMW